MVIYEREIKRLVIPTGEGNGAAYKPCSEAIAESFQEGYSSGRTDGYQEGYDAGIIADCGEAIEEAFQEGVQSGYTAGEMSVKPYWGQFNIIYRGEHSVPMAEGYYARNLMINSNGCDIVGQESGGRSYKFQFKTSFPVIQQISIELPFENDLEEGTSLYNLADYLVVGDAFDFEETQTELQILPSSYVEKIEDGDVKWYRVQIYCGDSYYLNSWYDGYQSGYTVGYQTASLDTIWEYWISIAFNIQGQGDYADLVKSQVSYTDRNGNEINPFDLQHNWLNYNGQVLSLFGNTQAFAYGVIKQNGYGSPQMGHLTIKAPEEGYFTSRYLYIRRKYDDEFAFPMFECDAVEFAEDTQVSSIFKSAITDSSQFPMQQSFGNISRPIMTIDGVEGYYETIPAGTHTLSFRGGSEFSDDMQIDITNFKGEIRIY